MSFLVHHVCQGYILRRPISYCTHGGEFRIIVFLAPRMCVALRLWSFWRWHGFLKQAVRFHVRRWTEVDEIRQRYFLNGQPWYD